MRDAWKTLLDHLNTRYADGEAWGIRQTDLFIELLYEMSGSLGYDFDKTQIKNSVYLPVAHGNLEQQETAIRSGLVKILSGKAAFPIVAQSATEEEAKEQDDLRRLLKAYLADTTPRSVKIVVDEPVREKIEKSNVKSSGSE